MQRYCFIGRYGLDLPFSRFNECTMADGYLLNNNASPIVVNDPSLSNVAHTAS